MKKLRVDEDNNEPLEFDGNENSDVCCGSLAITKTTKKIERKHKPIYLNSDDNLHTALNR